MKKYILLIASFVLIGCSSSDDSTPAPQGPIGGDNNGGGAGPTSPSIPTSCGVDLYLDGDSCVAVSAGEYSADGDASKTSCTNSGTNVATVTYTSVGGGSNNCSYTVDSCVMGYSSNDGVSCDIKNPDVYYIKNTSGVISLTSSIIASTQNILSPDSAKTFNVADEPISSSIISPSVNILNETDSTSVPYLPEGALFPHHDSSTTYNLDYSDIMTSLASNSPYVEYDTGLFSKFIEIELTRLTDFGVGNHGDIRFNTNIGFLLDGDNLYFNGLLSSSPDPTISKLFKLDLVNNTLEQISDTNAGGDDKPRHMTSHDGWVYFGSHNGSDGEKLFRTNGVDTIEQISNISPSGSDTIEILKSMNGWLYFVAMGGDFVRRLYRTNGSQLELVHNEGNVNSNAGIVEYNGWLYFVNREGNSDAKLYRTNGTTTERVSNTYPSGSDNVRDLTLYNNELYFIAHNSSNHSKLYKTDGSTITQLTDINDGNFDYIGGVAVFDNMLYLIAQSVSNSTTGKALYRTDGSSLLEQISETNGPSGHQYSQSLKSSGDSLYFLDNSPDGKRLYKTDGQSIDKHLVADEISGGQGFYLNTISGRDIFIDSPSGRKLYLKDGNRTIRISNINSSIDDDDISFNVDLVSFVHGNSLYFIGMNGTKKSIYKMTINE